MMFATGSTPCYTGPVLSQDRRNRVSERSRVGERKRVRRHPTCGGGCCLSGALGIDGIGLHTRARRVPEHATLARVGTK